MICFFLNFITQNCNIWSRALQLFMMMIMMIMTCYDLMCTEKLARGQKVEELWRKEEF